MARGKTVGRTIAARPGTWHLIHAFSRSQDRLATHFAAAITYFSFLSLIPVLMLSFAVAGFMLSSQPELLAHLKDEIVSLLPSGNLSEQIGQQIDRAIKQRLAIGIIGLVAALYSGVNWMKHVREATRAQWRPQWQQPEKVKGSILMQYLRDLVTLLGLFLAVVTTFSLTAVGTAAQQLVQGWLGIAEGSVLGTVLQIGPFVIAVVADTIIFAWVYTIMPYQDHRPGKRTLLIGSLAMSVCFEILKAALTILVSQASSSASGAVFGSILGLLLFFNLVARAFLLVAAWIATGVEDAQATADGSPKELREG